MMDVDSATNPPAYDSDDDISPRPGFALLEHFAYLANRYNATTAICDLRGPKLKGSLQVTFFTAQPPRVSYYCVHATDFPPTKFAIEPEILATEGCLALIRVVIGSLAALGKPHKREYFVYNAGAKGRQPSLKQLPNPSPYVFDEYSAAIVRYCRRRRPQRASIPCPHSDDRGDGEGNHDCRHCNYMITALRRGIDAPGPYDLCLYHSETDTWSTRQVLVQQVESYPHLGTSKAIVIGGEKGTVGFVDLWRGIVFCNVLTATNCPLVLRGLELPPAITPKAALGRGPARSVRDIAIVDGSIKFTELHNRFVLVSAIDGKYDSNGWKAAGWSMKITGSLGLESKWEKDYEIDSLQISASLPKLLADAPTAQPTLQSLHIGLPKLSLQDDGIVYFLAKIDHRDNDKAWVLALDTRGEAIHEVADFGAKRTLGLGVAYITSTISKYLKVAPGTKQQPKRQKRQESCSEQRPDVLFSSKEQQPQGQHETEVEEVRTGAEFSEDMVLE